MSDKSIKEKVYGLLWELFHDECPKLTYVIKNAIGEWGFNEFGWTMEQMHKGEQIWTILDEILPDEIFKTFSCGGGCHFRKNIECYRSGYLIDYVTMMDVTNLIQGHNSKQFYTTIWQAILSLLEAIKSHPEKDKMRFVWGEK